MGAFGPQRRPRGQKKTQKPSINHWFNSTLSEGAPKGAFARKVALFAKKPKIVKIHHFDENRWDLAKLALLREKGAPRRPNSRPNPERYGRRPSTCRIGPAQTRTGGLATPSKRSSVRRRTASPFPSHQPKTINFAYIYRCESDGLGIPWAQGDAKNNKMRVYIHRMKERVAQGRTRCQKTINLEYIYIG